MSWGSWGACRSAAAIAVGIVSITLFATPAAMAAPDPAPARVQMTEVGPVFATGSGMTLYTWFGDTGTPGKSNCTNAHYVTQTATTYGTFALPAAKTRKSCVDKWPPFLAAAGATPGGDWSLITRADGAKQWAWQGHPLHTSVRDHAAGEVNGEGTSRRDGTGWSAAKAPMDFPPGFKLVRKVVGLVLATADGKVAYVRGGPRLLPASADASASPEPVVAPEFGRVGGKWSIVDGDSGRKQYAYNGQALYVLPDGLTEADVDGAWTPALYRRAAPLPPQFHTRMTTVGHIYTTAQGKTLYVFGCLEEQSRDYLTCSDPGDAAVYWSALCGEPKECSRRWRPYLAEADARPSGDWTVVEVADPPFVDPAGATSPPGSPKVKAWAFRGRPLYTFIDDVEPGQTMGHAIQWYARSAFVAIQAPGEEVE